MDEWKIGNELENGNVVILKKEEKKNLKDM